MITAPLLLAFLLQAAPDDACVSKSSAARPSGLAFNHIVTLTNGCDHAMSCTVTTDANPKPTSVTLKKGETQDVTTYLASPARAFTPTVTCTPG